MLRLIAISFFVLTAYVGLQALRDLLTRTEPRESVPGIALAALSLVVMPALAIAKRRTGRSMASAPLSADSAETMLCALLSLILLVGLLLNANGWMVVGRPDRCDRDRCPRVWRRTRGMAGRVPGSGPAVRNSSRAAAHIHYLRVVTRSVMTPLWPGAPRDRCGGFRNV